MGRADELVIAGYGNRTISASARPRRHQWSAETGIYLDVHHHRAGGGRELYMRLLPRLTERG